MSEVQSFNPENYTMHLLITNIMPESCDLIIAALLSRQSVLNIR
ncbi:hypothetical protein [Hafnia sp. HMSC23F03]|nr:hypothetical protein [Hafnia sp. HMSC23F03]